MPRYKEEWWHTDHEGRRIGWLGPHYFKQWIEGMFPEGRAPRIQFAELMGMDVSKVHRWVTGKDPIPKWVAVLHQYHADGGFMNIHDVDAPWLPITTCVSGRQAPADAGTTTNKAA